MKFIEYLKMFFAVLLMIIISTYCLIIVFFSTVYKKVFKLKHTNHEQN